MRKARFTVASSTPSPFAVDDSANTASSLLLLSRVLECEEGIEYAFGIVGEVVVVFAGAAY